MILIDSFKGPYEFLSNFYRCPVEVAGHVYPSSENAFQSFKIDPMNGYSAAYYTLLSTCSPGESKKLGRGVELRSNWESMKEDAMWQCLFAKFTQNNALGNLLVATADAMLVEGNTWKDTYWGVCDGRGQNRLGYQLMELRAML